MGSFMDLSPETPGYEMVQPLIAAANGGASAGPDYTNLQEDSRYAFRVRNQGGTQHVQVRKSTDGSTLFAVDDAGISLTALTATSISTGTLTASSTVQASRFISTVAIGTAPLTVTSTTVVTNLNAEFLQGNHASAFLTQALADARYLQLSGGTLTGNLAVQGTLTTDSTATFGNAATDATIVTGTLDVGAGATVVGVGGANDQALFLKHNGGAGSASLGGSNSATPDLILKNNAGTQIGRFTDAGVLLAGALTAAIGTAGANDIVCNDVWMTDGANIRRISMAGTSLQISDNGATGTDMTIDSVGVVTVKDIDIDNDLEINGTGTTITFGGTSQTQTTVGAAGGASALPATPRGYLKVKVGSTSRVFPFYDA